MQFSIVTLLTVVAAVQAASVGSRYNKLVPRQASTVDVSAPAMVDASGNIVPFNAAGVVVNAAGRKN
ncbi:hypothetical protein ACHAQH_001406 [Verticillium albo-atrum]